MTFLVTTVRPFDKYICGQVAALFPESPNSNHAMAYPGLRW